MKPLYIVLQDNWNLSGTTTIIGGLVSQLDDSSGQYCFSFVNLGDCKAFLIKHKQKSISSEKLISDNIFKSSSPSSESSLSSSSNLIQSSSSDSLLSNSYDIVDLCEHNRFDMEDCKDPGGYLGCSNENQQPDLRNLSFHSVTCAKGDFILLVTDGVHDNFDPQFLGKNPSDLGVDSEDDTWSTVKDRMLASKAKESFQISLLRSVIRTHAEDESSIEPTIADQGEGESVSMSLNKSHRHRRRHSKRLTVKKIVSRLLSYVKRTTKSTRQWMEMNPTQKQPNDFVTFPGKMDHATVLAFEIGSLETEKQ